MNRHYILQSTIVLFLFIALSLPICAQSDEQKVNILLSEENYGQAITLLNSLISKDSSNARLFYKLGAAYYGAYKFASSLKPLLNAIKLDSLSSSYYYLLSKSTSSLGYNSEALKAARKAYSLDSMNLNIIFNLAGLLVGNKNYIEAAAYYGKAILADSTNSFAYSQAGHCWLKCNSIDLSVLYYKKALEYNPMDLNSAQQLAINYIFLNRITDALASADSSIKYWPNEAVFRKLKGEA